MSELCISASGRGIFEAERPKRARIPSQEAGLMPWPPRNLRFVGVGRGSKKLRDEQPNRRLRSQFACRNRFVQPRELQGQSFSSCASGVEKFAVRAANTLIKGQGVFLTHRQTRGDRATPSERPEHSGDSAALLDQRGAEIRAKTRWWKKSTTKSSKSPTTR